MTYSTTSAVPSALQGLTSVFGMGTGGTLALESPSNSQSPVGLKFEINKIKVL